MTPEHTPDDIDLSAVECVALLHETPMEASAVTINGLSGSSIEKKLTSISDHVSEENIQEGEAKASFDSSDWCHPSYLHLRVYGEADYLMMNGLKMQAKEKFLQSLVICTDRTSLSLVIDELYSKRADYRKIREEAIEVLVENLPHLRNGFVQAIDSELLKSFPQLAADLLLPMMDRYVPSPANLAPYPFPTGYQRGERDFQYKPLPL